MIPSHGINLIQIIFNIAQVCQRDLNQCFRKTVTMFIPSRLALAEEDVGSLGLGAKIGEKIMNARILPAHRSCMRQYLAKCSIESPKRLGPRVLQTTAAGSGERA